MLINFEKQTHKKENGVLLYDTPFVVSLTDWFESSEQKKAIVVKENNKDNNTISIVAISINSDFNDNVRKLYKTKYNNDEYDLLTGVTIREGVGFIGSCI